MKRNHLLILFIEILLALSVFTVAFSDTLEMPGNLSEIGTEAFAGDTSLGEVILPSGISAIYSKAFINSSLNAINLPPSLDTIASNAFNGSLLSTVYANWNTMGGNFALSKGIKLICPSSSISLNPVATISSSSKQPNGGTDVTSYLNRCFTAKSDTTLGWYKITAPSSGNFHFTVKAPNVTKAFKFFVYADRNGTETSLASFQFNQSNDIVTYTLTNISQGETIKWFVAGAPNYFTAFTQEFQLMVSEGSENTTEQSVEVTNLEVTPTERSLTCGKTFIVGTRLTPSGAQSTIHFESDDPSIVKIEDYKGTGVRVRGVSLGTTNVRASTADGKFSAECAVTVTLPQTQGVIATAASAPDDSIYVTWDATPGASGYIVYYSTRATWSSQSYSSINVSGHDNTSLELTELGWNKTLYIYVAAVNGNEIGERSAKVSATTAASSVPTATPVPTAIPDPTYFILKHGSDTLFELSSGNTSFTAPLNAAIGYDEDLGGSYYTITVTSNLSWSVSSNSDWFTMEKNGDKAILRVNENVTYRSMTGEAKFTVNGKAITMNVTKPEWSAGLNLKIYHKNLDGAIDAEIYYRHDVEEEYNNGITMGYAAGNGDTYTFFVESNFDWSLTTSGNWYNADRSDGEGGSTTKVVLTLNSNATSTKKTGTLNFTCGDNEQKISIDIVKPAGLTAPTISLDAANDTAFYNEQENKVWFNANFSNTTTLLIQELFNPAGTSVAFRNQWYVNSGLAAEHQIKYYEADFDNGGMALSGMNTIFPANSEEGKWTISVTACNSAGCSNPGTIDVFIKSIPAPVIINPDESLTNIFNTLKATFPNGSYWIHDTRNPVKVCHGNECRTTHVSTDGTHHIHGWDYKGYAMKNGNIYDELWDTATQCHGYGKMIGWIISGNNINNYQTCAKEFVDSEGICDGSRVDRATLIANLAPGDIIRVKSGHTMVILRTDTNNIYITDCNWNHKCGIRWGNNNNGVAFSRSLLKTGGTRELYYVMRYSDYNK